MYNQRRVAAPIISARHLYSIHPSLLIRMATCLLNDGRGKAFIIYRCRLTFVKHRDFCVVAAWFLELNEFKQSDAALLLTDVFDCTPRCQQMSF